MKLTTMNVIINGDYICIDAPMDQILNFYLPNRLLSKFEFILDASSDLNRILIFLSNKSKFEFLLDSSIDLNRILIFLSNKSKFELILDASVDLNRNRSACTDEVSSFARRSGS
jgi:hypothetical protein